MEILRRVKSSYHSSFQDVCVKVNDGDDCPSPLWISSQIPILHWLSNNLIKSALAYVAVTATLEAEDIDLYLRPLRRLISSLEETSFPQVDTLLPPLFHTLCLIWSRSRHYCTPQRMVVLLREFCNLILEKVQPWILSGSHEDLRLGRVFAPQAFAYLIPEELFKMELEEGQERVRMTIYVLRTFKQLFHIHRQKILTYFQHGQTVKLWDFPTSLVFRRSDRIMERLLMIEVGWKSDLSLKHSCGTSMNIWTVFCFWNLLVTFQNVFHLLCDL